MTHRTHQRRTRRRIRGGGGYEVIRPLLPLLGYNGIYREYAYANLY